MTRWRHGKIAIGAGTCRRLNVLKDVSGCFTSRGLDCKHANLPIAFELIDWESVLGKPQHVRSVRKLRGIIGNTAPGINLAVESPLLPHLHNASGNKPGGAENTWSPDNRVCREIGHASPSDRFGCSGMQNGWSALGQPISRNLPLVGPGLNGSRRRLCSSLKHEKRKGRRDRARRPR